MPDPPRTNSLRRPKNLRVPTGLVAAKVNVAWGSEPEIATDNWYADLDDDQLPDVAIGRLCVDSREELQTQVRKILVYEKYLDPGRWQRQINLVAGIGSFGPVTDAMIGDGDQEVPDRRDSRRLPDHDDVCQLAESLLPRSAPVSRGDVVSAERGLPVLDLHRSRSAAIPRPGLRSRRCLPDPGRGRRQANYMPRQGLPIAVLLACYTGAFDQAEDCLAEALLRAEGGPVAAICGSRVTMPYGMAVMSDALLDECFVQRRATLGELLLAAKRRMAADEKDNPRRQLLDALAAAISPAADQLPAERLEHIALFNLLGDPLLRLPQPRPIEVHAADSVRGGELLNVSGRCELAGQGWIELVCRRDRNRVSLPSRRQFVPTHAILAVLPRGISPSQRSRVGRPAVHGHRRRLRAAVGRAAGLQRPVPRAGLRRGPGRRGARRRRCVCAASNRGTAAGLLGGRQAPGTCAEIVTRTRQRRRRSERSARTAWTRECWT